jgi:hypothetical protein
MNPIARRDKMDIRTVIVFALFGVVIAVIVAMEVRTTKRINTYVATQRAQEELDEETALVKMFLELLRSDPKRREDELIYIRSVVKELTDQDPTTRRK